MKDRQSFACTIKETCIRSRKELRLEGSWLFGKGCLEKEIIFLVTKFIFKPIINYRYNLTKIQQAHLADKKKKKGTKPPPNHTNEEQSPEIS